MSPPTDPDVYGEEPPGDAHPIQGGSTAITALLGTAATGPMNVPVHIGSFADFEQRFGGLNDSSELAWAVRQFFLNGGTTAWIVRVAEPGELPQVKDGL